MKNRVIDRFSEPINNRWYLILLIYFWRKVGLPAGYATVPISSMQRTRARFSDGSDPLIKEKV